MTFGVTRASDHTVNLLLNNKELNGVETYGTLAGTLASLMGIAKEIRGDDHQSYYVNIRSLGRAWEQVKSDRPTKAESVEGFPSKITNYFKQRSLSKASGKDCIKAAKSEQNLVRDAVYQSMCRIRTAKTSKYEETKKSIAEKITSWGHKGSNLENVYSILKREMVGLDPDSAKVFADDLNPHGKLQVLEAIENSYVRGQRF